jgi:hypothetical protein
MYASRALGMSTGQIAALGGFFSKELIDATRILELRGERVANPDFYPRLRSWGFNNLPDQFAMDAITFSDVVVSHVPFTNELLFHELVHVEQYRQIGIPLFANLYVRGFLTGGEYKRIPLEKNAYDLGERYRRDPARQFSVKDVVRQWITEGKF